MVIIQLIDSHIFLHGLPSNKRTEIKNGRYLDKYYHSIIINEGAATLQGETPKVIMDNEKIIYIKQGSIIESIAKILKDSSVALQKIDAIPEGREREILQKLLE